MINLEKIKGVIFDLDGILVDTVGLHFLTWVEVLKQYGINFSKEDYFNYTGKREDIIASELIKFYNLTNIGGDSLSKQKMDLMKEWVGLKELNSMPYAKEVVKYFFDKKLKLAVCSGSQRNEAIIKLKRTSFYSSFPVIVAGSDVKRGKPCPDIYLLTTQKLGLKPQECLAFEDTQYGLESAKSAGLTCFAIPSEFSKKQDFSKADKIFPDLKELIELFKRI